MRHEFRKFILVWLLLLVACSRNGESSTFSTETTASVTDNTIEKETYAEDVSDTTTLRMIAYDRESGSYQDLIEIFEAENPGTEIKIVSLEETLGLGLDEASVWPENAAERLVSAADIIPAQAMSFSNSSSKLLLNLRPLMEADSTFDRSDFYPNALEYFESDGNIWGLPTSLSTSLIFYNKDAFDVAGLDYPQAGWSWDDLLAAAQATTIREGDRVTQWGLVQSGINPGQFVLPRSGPLIDTTTNPPIPRLNQPEVAAAMQWYTDLYLLHKVSPNLRPSSAFSAPPGFELIESGKAAMWTETSGWWEYRKNQMNVGAVPFPIDSNNDQTNQIFVNGFVVSAGTHSPEIAWRWLNFLSQQPPATNIPARRSVVEASGFWNRVDPELSNALQYALDHSYYSQFSPEYSALLEAANVILFQGRSVTAALAEAQVKAEMELDNSLADQENTEGTKGIIISEDAVEPENATTIMFLIEDDPNSLPKYRDLAKVFQAQYPAILVELKTPDFSNDLTTLRDRSAISDCLQWSGGVANKTDREAVLNIEPFLDSDIELSKDDFYPSAIEQFSYLGQMWGIPAKMNVPVIFYNKALFDAAGVAYPTANWTMNDFLEIAMALTVTSDDPEIQQYGYVPQEFEINDLSVFLDRLGAIFIDDSISPPRLIFTHPDTVEAMRWFANLTTELGVKPVFNTSIKNNSIGVGQERKTLIESGRAAMWSEQGVQTYPEINLEKLDIGIAPLPIGSDGIAPATTRATGYFISANTTQQQACWEWIKFLSEQPNIDNHGNIIPARRSIAESEAYSQAIGLEQATANLVSVESATDLSTFLRLNASDNWLATGFLWWLSYAYDQILTANVPVEDALASVQILADDYYNCVLTRGALEDRKEQRICLGMVDDNAPIFLIEPTEKE